MTNSPSLDVKFCLGRAAQCELFAEQLSNEDDRESMLEIARRWRQLAKSFEFSERLERKKKNDMDIR